ncbi:MAG TPA: TRAP transporter substrate-binding protein, partial [Chloroflexota bacterium]|nr:TRAP transporter substrate-binding protein [Chloroflexota bacterium]
APQPTAAPAKATSAPAASSAAPTNAAAPAKVQHVKLSDQAAEDHPEQKAFRDFAARVKELTNGAVIVDLFPNSVLGSPRGNIEQMQLGQLEFLKISTAALGGFVPQYQVFDLPYVFQSREHLLSKTDGEVGQTLSKLLESKLSIKTLGYFDAGARSIFNSKKPINTAADLKGMKIRVMESPLMIQTFNSMGALATPMAAGELYSALQQGVIDGAENSTVFYNSQKFNEVAKYYSYTEHFMTPDIPTVSLKWYNAQPKEIQQAIDQAGKELIQNERKYWLEYEKTTADDLKAKGVQFNNADKASIAKMVEPIYKDFEGKIGKDLMDKARAK